MPTNKLRVAVKKTRPDSFQWCPVREKRQQAQTEIQKSEYEEKYLNFAADGTLGQTVQGGCVISSGDIQNQPRHGPVRPAVAEPGFFGLAYLQKSLPMPVIL